MAFAEGGIMGNGIEIERKFLTEYPDLDIISAQKGYYKSDILQTYLAKEGARVRARRYDGKTVYYYTEKKKITDISRIENEREISKEEYDSLIKNADKTRKPIKKKRFVFEFSGHVFEIDVYPFWQDVAIMETELSKEDEEIVFPTFIKIIKEVTHDERYTNTSLAKL